MSPPPTSFRDWLSPPQDPASSNPGLTFSFSFSSLSSFGVKKVSPADIELAYTEAVASLSDRLGADEWFLGSSCVICF
jgi:hypothetical protein